MRNILVFGASGAQGGPVARHLLTAGKRVRVLARQPEGVTHLVAAGAEAVRGDFDDADSLARAAEGMEGAFLLFPFMNPRLDHARAVIGALAAAGVRRVVWNATGAIPPVRTGNPGVDIRRDVVDMLEESGMEFVALQPTVYMENLLGPWTAPEVAAHGRLAYPLPATVAVQWISHEDAGAFAAAAFDVLPGRRHLIYICGPEALTGSAAAAAFTRGLGRDIEYRAMPPAEFGAIIDKAFGGGGAGATAFYEAVAANPELIETRIDHAALLTLLPIRPTTLETFATRHAATLSAGGQA
jgi:NAD(P)H dehydrogenase (quinone)